jgi:hypothetical protein
MKQITNRITINFDDLILKIKKYCYINEIKNMFVYLYQIE